MGLFSKLMGDSKETAQPTKGIKELLEIELQDGEFTLPFKLWGHLTRYKLQKVNNNLWINGNKYFKIQDVSQMINDFVAKFGIDGHGDGNWTNEDNEFFDLDLGISRNWYFDENFNGKPIDWVLDDNNKYDYQRTISINCEKSKVTQFSNDEIGVEVSFTGWSDIKEYLKK